MLRTPSTATVFGLDVSANIQLPFLRNARAAPTGRTLEISVDPAGARSRAWPDAAEVVCDQREPDGTVSFRIEAHPQAGYLIWGPAYGKHILSPDGSHALCMPENCAQEDWQRLLIAQVLPFAAVLHGLEVFHASAVVLDGAAIAFVGPSRAGKTSVALELCRRGAVFMTDDVLVLERDDDDLFGQPATPVAGLDHAEAKRLEQSNGVDLGEVVATNARERIVRMRTAAAPAPLAAMFFLDRRRERLERPCFEPMAGAPQLLSATFNSVLTDPRRLRGLLEVCALAARRRVERILIGPGVDAAELALAVSQRLGMPT